MLYKVTYCARHVAVNTRLLKWVWLTQQLCDLQLQLHFIVIP